MPSPQKDVIYIDVDDEITAVIEKVQSSAAKIVALVLPKRASVFQSTVNMRLLKRSADSANKNLVLITSESSLLPLAGVVGLHVAKTLQSKPTIPAAPATPDTPVAVDDTEVIEDTAVAAAATAVAASSLSDEETIEVDNDELDESAAPTDAKKPFNKKLKVPNFDKFRFRLFIIITAVVLLIVGWVFAVKVLPKATVVIKTDTTDVKVSVAVVSSPKTTEANLETGEIPGALKELKKSDTQKAPATGKKDMGTKAKGTVTLTTQISCSTAQPATVPAGTVVTSGTSSFVMQVGSNYTFTGDISGSPPNVKCTWKTTAIPVVAQSAGDQHNLSARSYTVTGFSSVTAAGSAMSGGTSKIITVVSQQDVDSLKQKITDGQNSSANAEITAQLKDEGQFPLTETFTTKDPVVKVSPAVDTESAEVSVTVDSTYTMAGAKQDDLAKVLDAEITKGIDTSKQKILDNGLSQATVRIEEKQPDGTTRFSLDTTAKVGVEQNEADIKQAIAGKKKGEAKAIIQSRPGVKDVTIETSPFWVSKVPSNQDKINIIFEQQ